MSGYDQDRADFEYLETVEEVSDMVEIDADVRWLMANPTKKAAAEMYQSAIRLWFGEHGDKYADALDVQEIAERHGI